MASQVEPIVCKPINGKYPDKFKSGYIAVAKKEITSLLNNEGNYFSLKQIKNGEHIPVEEKNVSFFNVHHEYFDVIPCFPDMLFEHLKSYLDSFQGKYDLRQVENTQKDFEFLLECNSERWVVGIQDVDGGVEVCICEDKILQNADSLKLVIHILKMSNDLYENFCKNLP